MEHYHDARAAIFLAATSRGVVRAVRGARDDWSVEHPLDHQDVRCLANDPLNPAVIYAGTQGSGVLRSEDSGATWKPVGLAGLIIKSLAISQTEPGTLYAGTKPAWLFVSRDSGATWSELEGFRRIPGRWYWASPAEKPFKAWVQGIALSPVDPQIKAHRPGRADAYIFRVKDDSAWEKLGAKGSLPQPLDHMPYALRTDPTTPGHLYAGLLNGDVWFSPDYGDSWGQFPFNLSLLQDLILQVRAR